MKTNASVVFLTVVLAGSPWQGGRAQDVWYYDLIREEFFTQATTNRAATGTAVTHDLFGGLVPIPGGSLSSVALNAPSAAGGWSLPMEFDGTGFVTSFTPGETSRLSRPAVSGQYVFQALTSNGVTEGAGATLPGPANVYAPPRVANFVEAQNVDASEPFTLRWDKIIGTKLHDYVGVAIFATNGDRVFSGSRQSGSATNFTIQAGTLQPGSNYNAELFLTHYFTYGTNRSPVQFIGEERVTRFPLTTQNPAGVFAFASGGFLGHESDGTATITVERTQGNQGDVTVDYFTADGTAADGTNYLGVSGTLSFPNGVTNQTFDVPLLNNGVSNAPLTVHLTLTNATGGARLEVRPHAVLSILDAEGAPGTNVEAYLLGKTEIYSQTSATSVTQSNRSVTCDFEVDIHPAFPGAVVGATMQLPNKTTRELVTSFANYQDFHYYLEDFPSALSLNKAFPAGKYLITVQTLTDGTVTIPVNLGVEPKFSVPQLTNWDQAQAIDPASPFTMELAPFASATTNDYIRIVIVDEHGEYLVYTPNAFRPGALPGSTSSYTIPANTLDYGKRYEAELLYEKVKLPTKPTNPGIRGGLTFVHTTVVFLNTIAASK